MKVLYWNEDSPKRVELKMKGGTATLHFTKGKSVYVPEDIWDELKIKLSDDIQNKRISISDKKSESIKSKGKNKKDKSIDDEIGVGELL